jgi:hypothetical protein
MTGQQSSAARYANAAVVVLGVILGAWGAEEHAGEVPAPPAADLGAPVSEFSLWDLYAGPPTSLSNLYGRRLIYVSTQPWAFSAAASSPSPEAPQELQGD